MAATAAAGTTAAEEVLSEFAQVMRDWGYPDAPLPSPGEASRVLAASLGRWCGQEHCISMDMRNERE